MFNLYYGNDTARLADQLGARLTAHALANPLTPALVLVPQPGLRRWLQVHLAEQLGVVANLDFRAPAQFAWDLLRAARPDLPRQSPFDPDVLRWHLYALLGKALDATALTALRGYLCADSDPLRRYALAGELARVFERLQGYRRERLLKWERGSDPNDWQAELWRRLLQRLGGDYRAARLDTWLKQYAGDAAPPGLPARISAFACANVSPDVLRMLGVAAHHTQVDFYWPTPCREYWGDVPRSRRLFRQLAAQGVDDNPLLASLGGAGAEFAGLLFGYDEVQPEIEEDLSEAPPRKTLLGRVRADILDRRKPTQSERIAEPDSSLQFHACHSPLREVQTLHDRLLALFDADPTLTPRDIAVMMPDVATYRPYIDAVFGGLPEHDPRFIPYSVGDVGAAAAHPAAQLFLRLLDAPTSRWEAGELLDVLAVPGVMRRFDLDADDLALLMRQVRDARVCWGEDEGARAGCGGYREFSFAFGLDRLLAGFAVGDADALVAGVAPMPGIEGAQFARLDALLAVLDAWRNLRGMASQSLSPKDWQRHLNALFDGLYAPDADDAGEMRALERVHAALERLVEDTEAAGLAQPLPWPDLRAFLRERLADADPRQRLFAGGVTFCGMVPLRVVPFRVICLLGMDEAAFPRRETSALDPLLADRRAGRSKRGDRSVRDDDRLLFLQLIAAARDTLYISWVGRDAHSNEALPSSVVVAELIDDVKQGYLLESRPGEPRDGYLSPLQDNAGLVAIQPLHAFDPRLFDPRCIDAQSFRHEWLAAARPSRQVTGMPPFVHDGLPAVADAKDAEAATRVLRLDDLRRFFRNPAQGFLEHGLGLRLPRDDEDTDDEPLAPRDGLTRWRLTRALLEPGDGGIGAITNALRARGELPPGAFGDEALRAARTRAEALREKVFAFTAGTRPAPAQTLEVLLPDGTRLSGALADRYPQGLLRVRAGNLDGRHVLDAWLDALFAIASGDAAATLLVALEKDEAITFALPQPTPQAAHAALAAMVASYRAGLRAPLPFFVRTSWEHAVYCAKHDAGAANGDTDDPIDLACFEKAVDRSDDGFGGANELGEAAASIAWRGVDLSGGADPALAQRLHRAALAVFAEPARAWVAQP